MASPNEKLAASLDEIKRLQKDGRRVFRSDELTRTHRERLQDAKFIQEVTRGWVMSSDPGARPGDSTLWYATIWEFCAAYCEFRYGSDWHLSVEQSLMLHAENTVVPAQLLVMSPAGTNNRVELPFNSSIYNLKERTFPHRDDIAVRDGLRIFTLEAGLIKAPEHFYQRSPVEAETCLASVRDPSDLLRRLLDGGNSVVAGRLAGAFRHIGRNDAADEITGVMKSAGYRVSETDPFEAGYARSSICQAQPPIVLRLRAMWQQARDIVLAAFPPAPGLPKEPKAYIAALEDIYVNDAYHSLSIEGYRVTPELIGRVRTGTWDPDKYDGDRKSQDAMAARGYWQAFGRVKDSVARILNGDPSPDMVTRNEIHAWYREMFAPAAQAGIIEAGALAGFRSGPVNLRTSRFIPPRRELVRDAMDCLLDLLNNEPQPAVRAVLGHWLFGYIHPYPDGNGRCSRFLMNAMLASGGYPWTIIRLETRPDYLAALDRASIENDLQPFANFVADQVKWSMDNGFKSATHE